VLVSPAWVSASGGVDVGQLRRRRCCSSLRWLQRPVMAAMARLQRPVMAAAATGDGGCGAAAAANNGDCGVWWRLQQPVTAVAAASRSADCGGIEARISGSGKKSDSNYHVRGEE
jgi:hypothetical protein